MPDPQKILLGLKDIAKNGKLLSPFSRRGGKRLFDKTVQNRGDGPLDDGVLPLEKIRPRLQRLARGHRLAYFIREGKLDRRREALKKYASIVLIFVLGLLTVSLALWAETIPQSDPTASELIAKCAQAMGGQAKIESLKTLRLGTVFPDHGERTLFIEIRRPNLSYNPQGQLAFDGKRACFLRGQDGKSEPQLVDPAELVDFDVEIGYYFPAFFDFPSEYVGSETIDGRTFYKIRPQLSHGAEMIYYLDTESGLPSKIVVHMVIRGQSLGNERILSDYKKVDGILYPHGFTYPSRDRKSVIQGRVTSVEFNVPLDEAHFTIPKNIK